MSRVIDVPETVALVDAAIELRGRKYVYPRPQGAGCQYVTNLGTPEQEPGCIIGAALINGGVVEPEFFLGENNAGEYNHLIINAIYESIPGVEFTSQAMSYMSIVQARQDCGESWGASVDYAKSKLDIN